MRIETGHINTRYLYQNIMDGRIIVPEYQREFCWDDSKIELLIDSLMNDIPIGVFQFRKIETEREKYEVVDGLHRIRTLYKILLGNGVYFNFDKLRFTLDPNDYDYSKYVRKPGGLSTLIILGNRKDDHDFELSKTFYPFYEKIYRTELLKFTFIGTDDEVKIAFDRINQVGISCTPIFNQVSGRSTLII